MDIVNILEECGKMINYWGVYTDGYYVGNRNYKDDIKKVDEWINEAKNNGWISVEDRLPKTDGKYIVFIPRLQGEGRYAETYYDPSCDSWGVGEKVSHWMALPFPPPSTK